MLHEFLENIIEIIAMRNEKVVVFDWNAYIHLYRDIANAGFVSRKQVIGHMIHHGQYNKRLLLDTDGNNYYHVFNKNEYETIIYKNFETEEDAYIHFCDNHNDVSLICKKLFIKKKYIESYKGTVLLDKITRIVMKYNNINELYHSEEKNTSFSELCTQIYNDHHKIEIKAKIGDNNILYGNNTTDIAMEKNDNCEMKVFSINDFKCINVENKHDYEHLISTTNGDTINETNFVKHITQENITLYYNNKFIFGNKDLKPEITISRNVNYSDVINKKNLFLSNIPYNNASNGLYFITQSMIDAVKDKNSLLYPHVYDHSLINEIIKKPAFLHEQFVDKSWYNWATDDEITELKLKHFPKDAFVICICGRIAINSYPKSLLESIKLLREQGYNIHLLALTKFEVSPHRLTQNLYDEIISYDWVKSITVDKKDVLNYFRMCDVLTSTYRDYCNHVGGSNKIKEYLLCDKPILCSRGKERENELGKDYPGFYDCKTCDTVPPLCWTQEFIKNPGCYKKQYETYFNAIDKFDLSCSLYIYMKIEIMQICKIISRYLDTHK